MGAHILFDRTINRAEQPCGSCLLPAQVCRYIVVKGKGAKGSYRVDWRKTNGCGRAVNFSYKPASEYKDNAPCTNVPLQCKLCPTDAPAVWRYNFRYHLEQAHTEDAIARYASMYTLTDDEMTGMHNIWNARHKSKASKQTKSRNAPSLTISEAHRSVATLHACVCQPSGVLPC